MADALLKTKRMLGHRPPHVGASFLWYLAGPQRPTGPHPGGSLSQKMIPPSPRIQATGVAQPVAFEALDRFAVKLQPADQPVEGGKGEERENQASAVERT